MPNWCTNTLQVYGPAEDVEAFKAKAAGHSPWLEAGETAEFSVLNFPSLVPIPGEVLRAGYDVAGYDWEIANWGCKWGACHAEISDEWEGHVIYRFDTAWSPPTEFLARVAKHWPRLTFLLDYDEPGVGFKGIAKARAEHVEDYCVSY